PKQPSRWWLFPGTSVATIPAKVTNFAPGVTGENHPRGNGVLLRSTSVTPASARSPPLRSSNAGMRLAQRAVNACSPERAGSGEAPCERPTPRLGAAPGVSAGRCSPSSSRPGCGSRRQPRGCGSFDAEPAGPDAPEPGAAESDAAESDAAESDAAESDAAESD